MPHAPQLTPMTSIKPPTSSASSASAQADLRLRAQAWLNTRTDIAFDAAAPARKQASAAMRVLYELAASPDTAPDALALLHELQVHQVELDMQAEALLAAHTELQSRLDQANSLHDSMPVACFSVDADTRVLDVNPRGARLLGMTPEAVLGCKLGELVSPRGALQALLQQRATHPHGDPSDTASATMQLTCSGQAPRSVLACVGAEAGSALHVLCLCELPEVTGA